MKNEFILTPYFLDERLSAYLPLAGPQWQVIERDLSEFDAADDDRTNSERQQRMALLYELLTEAVTAAIRQGQRPVSVAGDCCTSLAVFAGIQKAGQSPTLLWLDAHGDFNTPQTTPSGFLGGMPLAMLVGRGDLTIPERLGLGAVPESNVWLTDGRDLDPEEQKALQASAVTVISDPQQLLDGSIPDGPLYVHFDCDILNPTEAPAMNYPAPGGPPAETLRTLFRRLARSGQVMAVSLSAWNPALDEDGRTKQLVLSLLSELVG